MRTTVTLDTDVEQLLRDSMQRNRQSFKVALNEAVRKALSLQQQTTNERPYKFQPRAMRMRTGIDPLRLNQLEDDLEVDRFLEVTHKLSSGDKKP